MKNLLNLGEMKLINDVEVSNINGGQCLCGIGYDFHTCISYELKYSQSVILSKDRTTCIGTFTAAKV